MKYNCPGMSKVWYVLPFIFRNRNLCKILEGIEIKGGVMGYDM